MNDDLQKRIQDALANAQNLGELADAGPHSNWRGIATHLSRAK